MPQIPNIQQLVDQDLAALRVIPAGIAAGPRTLADAQHTARFFEARYAPSGAGAQRVPGLRDGNLPEHYGAAVYHVTTELGLLAIARYGVGGRFPAGEVRACVTELQAFLDYVALDDEAFAAKVTELRAAHRRARRVDDRVIALEQYVAVAREREPQLRGLPAFDPALLGRCEALLAAHRAFVAADAALQPRRDALTALLRHYVQRIVKAADLVYRRQPAVAREARAPRVLQRAAAATSARKRNAGAAVEVDERAEGSAATPVPPTVPRADEIALPA